jgi:hypothetical protein
MLWAIQRQCHETIQAEILVMQCGTCPVICHLISRTLVIRNEEHTTAKENAGYRGSLYVYCNFRSIQYNFLAWRPKFHTVMKYPFETTFWFKSVLPLSSGNLEQQMLMCSTVLLAL